LDTPGRSSEHHVVVGLGFLSSLKQGDIDACVEMLHPDAEWHPSPKMLDSEVFRGREQVRHQIKALHDRFDGQLEITPEDGRQIGDHVLLVAVFSGINEITRREVKSRECWVISIRDDMWARIVVYPNAPAARLGFEETLRTASSESEAEMETVHHNGDAPQVPAEAVTIEVPGEPPFLPADEESHTNGQRLTLTFTLEEAAALNRWLSQPSDDGTLAAYDTAAWPGLMKIRTAVEHAQAIADIREAFAQADVDSGHLNDAALARLAEAIALNGRVLAREWVAAASD
jgi:ketosteroid isomerase-like protein